MLGSTPPAIEIRGLVKRYGDLRAVDGLSLRIEAGDFYGLLGPNGAGKTTTINSLVGLSSIQEGRVAVFGHDVVKDYRAARRLIGLSPQEFNFDRYLTIKEVLLFSAGYFGIPRKVAEPRAIALLKQFDLYGKRDETFLKLSGGMKRRLSMARALIHEPKVLILDEPTAGVDVELRLELWQWLRELNRAGMTIILTTHYLEEAQDLCQTIGIIQSGRLITEERTDRLLTGQGAGRNLQDVFLELTRRVSHG